MTLILLIKSDFFHDGDQRLQINDPGRITFQQLAEEIQREYELPVSHYRLYLPDGEIPFEPEITLSEPNLANNAILHFKEAALPRNAYLQSDNGTIFHLKRTESLIGRPNPKKGLPAALIDVDLTPLDPKHTSSRPHAVLRCDSDNYYLSSLRDDNPAYVNGDKVATDDRCLIRSGDVIKCGAVVLTFFGGQQP